MSIIYSRFRQFEQKKVQKDFNERVFIDKNICDYFFNTTPLSHIILSSL